MGEIECGEGWWVGVCAMAVASAHPQAVEVQATFGVLLRMVGGGVEVINNARLLVCVDAAGLNFFPGRKKRLST